MRTHARPSARPQRLGQARPAPGKTLPVEAESRFAKVPAGALRAAGDLRAAPGGACLEVLLIPEQDSLFDLRCPLGKIIQSILSEFSYDSQPCSSLGNGAQLGSFLG